MNIDDLRRRCESITTEHPLSIGFRETPVASIVQMAVGAQDIDVALTAPSLWDGIRRIHVPNSIWEPSDEAESPDPLNLTLFWLEETLDNGSWQRWTRREDGTYDPPAIDSLVQDLLTVPVEPTRVHYLKQFQTILDIVGDSIVFYLKPDQWQKLSAPDSAYDPPKLLEHADLVRIAPFTIEAFDLDSEAVHWQLILRSQHFPESRRRIHVILPPNKVPEEVNPPGFLWWNLRSACEAWFDLYYSPNVPEEKKEEQYQYGGWHANTDDSWNLELLGDMN